MSDSQEREPAFETAGIEPARLAQLGERVLAHEWTEEEFSVHGVDVQVLSGIWVVMLAAYDPDNEEGEIPGVDDRAVAERWIADAHASAVTAWGEPMERTAQLVGDEQVPESVVDVVLTTLGVPNAEMWDRGERFLALVTGWRGEPGKSTLLQVLLVLPRRVAMGGLGAALGGEITEQPHLMHGESLGELHRRAAILSTIFGQGEKRISWPVPSTRCDLASRAGTATSWTFLDDGRSLLLISHPDVDLGDGDDEAALIASARIVGGLPADVRALAHAPATLANGSPAQHVLEFALLGDEPVPHVTAALWFDGEVWQATEGLIELAARRGMGLDDFGFDDAVTRPFRLGGSFDLEDLLPPERDRAGQEERERRRRVFDQCPYPPGPRPDGELRLGYQIPRDHSLTEIADDIERITELWWQERAEPSAWNDDRFRIVGRSIMPDDDDRAASVILAEADEWNLDALAAWADGVLVLMRERWGDPLDLTVHHARTGEVLRSPTTRIMRAAGFEAAIVWWVNGHAVALMGGTESESSIGVPSVMIVIAKADAVLDFAKGTLIWELRSRARVVGELVGTGAEPLDWDGPELPGSDIVPLASRGGIRTGFAAWVWFFTPDNRGLLVACTNGLVGDQAAPDAFERQAELFEGIPADLLSLIVDRDPGGLYDVVERQAVGPDDGRILDRAVRLPVATGVYWHDGLDWRASDGLLRRAGDEVVRADRLTGDPLLWLRSADSGVEQLSQVLNLGAGFAPETFEYDHYTDFVLGGPADPEAVGAAFDSLRPALEAALTGTLNDVIDAVWTGTPYRYLLDAALSNHDPRSRREIALWLLQYDGARPSTQLSSLTPIGVLLENRTLDAGDAVVLRRLIERGAVTASLAPGATIQGDAEAQLTARALPAAEDEALRGALREALAERAAQDEEAEAVERE